jgi:hypothetical protein
LSWDSKNQKGIEVASGIYFLSVRFTDISGNSHYQVRKMVHTK